MLEAGKKHSADCVHVKVLHLISKFGCVFEEERVELFAFEKSSLLENLNVCLRLAKELNLR